MISIEIFTDGACSGNPGPGGWAALIRTSDGSSEAISGAERKTTNNRMELFGAIAGLEKLSAVGSVYLRSEPTIITLHTDSRYLVDGMTKWLRDWKRRNWRTAGGQPVKNLDLWQRLAEAAKPHRIDWRWVKGHNGHPDNEHVDQLARAAIATLR